MHAALSSDTILTQRYVRGSRSDMFYRDPTLFGSQRTVDSMVARACLTLGLPRSALGVCATPNGLVYGCVQFAPGEPCALVERLIPDASQITHVRSRAAWVLVVEKHAVYQTLRSLDFLTLGPTYGVAAPGALVTGKGYPDQATRALLARWAQTQRAPHLFFLLDGDPHGVDILRTYLAALEGIEVQAHWVGLRVQQWLALRTRHGVPCLALTRADRAKARHLLRDGTLPAPLRAELAHQLHAGYKCELEVLCTAHADAGGVLAPFVYAEIGARLLPSACASRGTPPAQWPCRASRRRARRSGGAGSPSHGSRRRTRPPRPGSAAAPPRRPRA